MSEPLNDYKIRIFCPLLILLVMLKLYANFVNIFLKDLKFAITISLLMDLFKQISLLRKYHI